MVKCVIVDDEMGAVEILKEYVKRTPDLQVAGAFRDSVEALNFLSQHETDLLFLDIDMPNLNGMQLADLLRNRRTGIIFCTAYADYAVESYERNAIDYLLKPIPYDRFLKAVEKGRASQQQAATPASPSSTLCKKLFVKSGATIHQLDLDDILYLKKDGHYIVFHTASGEVLSRMTVEEVLSVLPENRFVRVHKSYIVSLDKIETIEKHDLFIRGCEIPIGGSYRLEFLKRIEWAGS